ncbi:MAG: PorV/PorQ family protein, partial [Candidatus Cloacimonetes bacterium]|nr:PorV/PorQ family protein [Candidatus Cloacimonadota bacterium]
MRYKHYVIIALLSMQLSLAVAINEKAGTAGFAFFKVRFSPRAAAMANAYTGMSDQADAVFFNTAGLSQLKNDEIIASYMNYFDGFNGGSVVYARRFDDKINFAFFSQFLTSGDIEKTIVSSTGGYEIVGDFAASEFIFGGGVSYDFHEIVKFGFNLKFIYESIDKKSQSAIATDLSLLHQTTNEKIMLGLSLMNLGTQLSKFTESSPTVDLPITAQIGINYLALENLQFNLDLCRPLHGDFSGMIGTEWKVVDTFKLRAGF